MDTYRIIITGVSRGLGRDLIKLVIEKNPSFHIIGTVRANAKQTQQKLLKQYPNANVSIQELDILKRESVDKFCAQKVKQNLLLDCLINNSGVGADYGQKIPPLQIAENTLHTNFTGTVYLTNALLPLLKSNGRIINVSSKLGGLIFHGKETVQKYTNPNITLEQIHQQVDFYLQGCKKQNLGDYYKSAYGTSKMMLNAWSRFILKKQLKGEQLVVSMSPGHCKTDMGKDHASRTSLEGATTIYNHIFGQYQADAFYHIGSKTDFETCG